MAGNSTATITFKLDGDVKTFQILAKDAESLKKVLGNTNGITGNSALIGKRCPGVPRQ